MMQILRHSHAYNIEWKKLILIPAMVNTLIAHMKHDRFPGNDLVASYCTVISTLF